jgi:hypothetical protein
MDRVVAYVALVLGASLSLLNFYVSVVRVPLLRACGWSPRWVSGIPLFGSMLLVLSAVLFWRERWAAVTALTLAVLDTGGIHWFFGALTWDLITARNRDRVA